MQILLFTDLHFFPHFGKSVFEDTAQSFLLHVVKYCKENNITKIHFLGDWFHLKNKIQVQSFIKSFDILSEFKKAGLDVTFIIGNHDAPEAESTDYSILHSFKDYGTVVPLYEWEDCGDTRFHHLSYTKTLPEFEMGPGKNVLFSHLDINDFSMDGSYICDNGFDAQSFKSFDKVFSGHFHNHQVLKNIVYVGSPFQIKWSERHDKKGFILLDSDSLQWNFVEYKGAPVFKEVSVESYDAKEVNGNFVRVVTNSDSDAKVINKVKEDLLEVGAESVDFSFEASSEEKKEINVIENLTIGTMVDLAKQYLDTLLEKGGMNADLEALVSSGKMNKQDFMKVFNDVENAYLTGWKPGKDDK